VEGKTEIAAIQEVNNVVSAGPLIAIKYI